jgi:hypothetical protein
MERELSGLAVRSDGVPVNRRRLRLAGVIGMALVVVLAGIGYGIYRAFQNAGPTAAGPPPPGCQAGTGPQAIYLDPGQAAIAATIAGIAARHKLPRQAVTIAYATALQESQLQNLDYGDRDSVGVFQQRPSQGWGTTAEIEDPVYATTRFFDALVRVHNYTKMPVDVAAQDVQHSGDGAAYGQWATVAAQLASYFTGSAPHGVSCWYSPPERADLTGLAGSLSQTFGPPGRNGVLVGVNTGRSGKKGGRTEVVRVQRAAAWTVANWLVAHAENYGFSQVRYAGYEWMAAGGSMGWQRDADPSSAEDPPRGIIVAG